MLSSAWCMKECLCPKKTYSPYMEFSQLATKGVNYLILLVLERSHGN